MDPIDYQSTGISNGEENESNYREPQRHAAEADGKTEGRTGSKVRSSPNGSKDPSLPVSLGKRHKRKGNLLQYKPLAWRRP